MDKIKDMFKSRNKLFYLFSIVFFIFFLLLIYMYFLNISEGVLSILISKNLKQGNFSKVENLYSTSLSIQNWYIKHCRTNDDIRLNNLIKFLLSQKDYKGLIELYEKYIEKGKWYYLSRIILVTPIFDEANVYSDLGLYYLKDNQYEKSLMSFKKSIEMKLTEINLNNLNYKALYLAEDYNRLAMLYLSKNDLKNAKKYIDKATGILDNVSENNEKYVFFNNLIKSDYYIKMKNYKQAEYFANQLFLSIPASSLPVKSYIKYQSYYWVISNEQMGKVKYLEKEYSDAEQFQRKVLFSMNELYDQKSPEMTCAYYNLLQTQKLLTNEKDYEYIKDKIIKNSRTFLIYKGKNITIDEVSRFCSK